MNLEKEFRNYYLKLKKCFSLLHMESLTLPYFFRLVRGIWRENEKEKESIEYLLHEMFQQNPPKEEKAVQTIFEAFKDTFNFQVEIYKTFDRYYFDEEGTWDDFLAEVSDFLYQEMEPKSLRVILIEEANQLLEEAEYYINFEFDTKNIPELVGEDNPFEQYPDPQANFYFLIENLNMIMAEEEEDDFKFWAKSLIQSIFECGYFLDVLRRERYLYRSKNIGPNAPCPCGSGKKFKQCHGK